MTSQEVAFSLRVFLLLVRLDLLINKVSLALRTYVVIAECFAFHDRETIFI